MSTAKQPSADPVKEVLNFIIDGHSNSDILEYLKANGIEGKEAKAIFEQAFESFMKATRMPVEVRRGWCLEAYRHLYQKLVSTGDYAGAMRAIQEISKLSEAKTTPAKVETYINDLLDIKTTTAELADALKVVK